MTNLTPSLNHFTEPVQLAPSMVLVWGLLSANGLWRATGVRSGRTMQSAEVQSFAYHWPYVTEKAGPKTINDDVRLLLRLAAISPSGAPDELQRHQDGSERLARTESVRFLAIWSSTSRSLQKAGLPPLAVYNPIHYQELPELFMDFVSSLTGKSPSTTAFGSEGALTKGPFNALWPVVDLNNALVCAILTGYPGIQRPQATSVRTSASITTSAC